MPPEASGASLSGGARPVSGPTGSDRIGLAATDPIEIDWGTFFERYRPIAVRFAGGLARDAHAGEDLFQEAARSVFERARDGKARFESTEHARNYFFRAIRNLAAERGRRASRAKTVDLDEASEADGGTPDPLRVLLSAESGGIRARRVAVLASALETLEPASREALRLRYAEGLTYQEVSDRTGVALSTLQARVESALKRLRKKIGKGEVEP